MSGAFEESVKRYAKNLLRPDHIEAIFRPIADWPEASLTSSKEEEKKTFVCKFSPGNGTTYRLLICKLEEEEMEKLGYDAFPKDSWILTLVAEGGWARQHVLAFHGWALHPNYLEDKLGIGPADSVSLAIILYRTGLNLGYVN